MSETPKTDAMVSCGGGIIGSRALSQIEYEQRGRIARIERERDEARADAESWREQAEARVDDVLEQARLAKEARIERDEALEQCAAMQQDARDYLSLADERDAWRDCAQKLNACLEFWMDHVCDRFDKLKGKNLAGAGTSHLICRRSCESAGGGRVSLPTTYHVPEDQIHQSKTVDGD